MPGHIRWDGQTIHYQRKIVESRGIGKQPQLRTTNCHKLTLGLKVLGLGRTLYLLGRILDSLSRTANLIQDAVFHSPGLETAAARSA